MTYRCSPGPTPALNLLAATTALCLAWPAHAGRPLSVDDAGVDEVGQGHVEVWWEGQRGQPGTVYVAPAFTPSAGLELGAVLARDRNERHTLQGLQAKWLWSPAQEQGCNAGSSAGVVHRRQGAGQSAGSVVALNLIGTCAATWGVVNANVGSQRERGQSWRATWGASVERSWGAITPHLGSLWHPAQRPHVPDRRPVGVGARQAARRHHWPPAGAHLAERGVCAGVLTPHHTAA